MITKNLSELIKSYISDDQIRLVICERRFGAVIELNLINLEGKKSWWITQLRVDPNTTKKEKLASYILKEAIKIVYKKYPAQIYVSSSNWGVFLEHQKDFYLNNSFVRKGSYFVCG